MPGSGISLPLNLPNIAARCKGSYYAPRRFAAVCAYRLKLAGCCFDVVFLLRLTGPARIRQPALPRAGIPYVLGLETPPAMPLMLLACNDTHVTTMVLPCPPHRHWKTGGNRHGRTRRCAPGHLTGADATGAGGQCSPARAQLCGKFKLRIKHEASLSTESPSFWLELCALNCCLAL